MLQSKLLRDRGILVLSPQGPIEKADFERVANEVDPYIAENGKLAGVLIHAKSFPGWESFGALLAHLRFVRDHHRRIERIAVASDSEFLKIAPKIAEHFVKAEVKRFDYAEKEQALAWLATGR